jgi:hypothetical protein
MNQLNHKAPEKSDATDEFLSYSLYTYIKTKIYRGADKSLARRRRKQATATEDFDVHISYL